MTRRIVELIEQSAFRCLSLRESMYKSDQYSRNHENP